MARPKTLNNPKPVHVKLPKDLHRAVKFLAVDTDSDMSKIIRAALKDYVCKAGPEFKAMLNEQSK